MTNIIHAMLGEGMGGLERVFVDYQPILQHWAAARGGHCLAVVRRGAAAQALVGAGPVAAIPAFSDWDPVTLSAARRLVAAEKPDLILSHGQRPARVFARVAPPGTTLAICVHKPVFDLDVVRTHYICVGRHLADLAIARGAPPAHVHVVENGVRPATTLAEPFADAARPPRIVAAGRLHPKKGFDDLIRAMALLRDRGVSATCEIAGEGDERPALTALIAALGLGDRVSLVGWRKDVTGFLATGDLFAFPSHQEGFPLILLEAMSAALPVVSSIIPGPDEMIDDGETGLLVPDHDPDALARALARLIGDPGKARALGAAARAKVLAGHGPDQMARRLEATLQEITRRT